MNLERECEQLKALGGASRRMSRVGRSAQDSKTAEKGEVIVEEEEEEGEKENNEVTGAGSGGISYNI